MVNPIQFPNINSLATNGIGGVGSALPPGVAGPPATVEGKDFRSILMDSLNEVNRLQTEADQGVQKLVTGETNNVAEVFATVNKAGIAFDLLMQVRNKLIDAYQEIQQMRS
ncbi:MAG: flagellar hook-basal body complex protein FliE [Planctomycetes bacterium]|nr:flagellar hook-basal body complex protein FliE [Planctomycetota bacterium]MBI3835307.1 flagellar hook-basal body complex protein FliE [Planctomycetota bacterium]